MRIYFVIISIFLGFSFCIYLILNYQLSIYNRNTNILVSNNKIGCCYDVGFISFSAPIFNNYRTVPRILCKTENRIGGATRFNDLPCESLKEKQVNLKI